MKKINVALVGLGFGGAFLPIYREHPQVGKVKIVDINTALQNHFKRKWGQTAATAALRRSLTIRELMLSTL